MPELDFSSSSKFKISIGTALVIGSGFLLNVFFSLAILIFDPVRKSNLEQVYGCLIGWYLFFQATFMAILPLAVIAVLWVGVGYFWKGIREWKQEIEEAKKERDRLQASAEAVATEEEKIEIDDSLIEQSDTAVSFGIRGTSQRGSQHEEALVEKLKSLGSQKYEFEVNYKFQGLTLDLVAKPIIRSPLGSKDIVIEIKVLKKGAKFDWFRLALEKILLCARLYSLSFGRETLPILIIVAEQDVLDAMGFREMNFKAEVIETIKNGIPVVRTLKPAQIQELNFEKMVNLLRETSRGE